MQVSFARQLLTAARLSRAGRCAVLTAILVAFGSRGLQTAVANGDTRTITMHHIHTDEDITITYKRDGRYDEEALKKLDWFVRDWRREESTHMSPQLYDLVWEVAREIGGDQPIHVVCGYRSPSTNAMLRHRSSGVAQFSQHMLGKAMDFYIPGASLEQMRIIGLRLQRGGVGYYPTSGSPFVHLDVGPVRYWPRMTHEQLAHVFPDGRTVHIPSDGHPLAGYAQALAEIEKRGSSVPNQASLDSAHAAGVDTSIVHKKGLLASLFSRDEEEEPEAAPAPAAVPAPRRGNTYALASLESKPYLDAKNLEPKTEPVRAAVPTIPVPAARPSRAPAAIEAAIVAPAPVAGGNIAPSGAPPSGTLSFAAPSRDDWTFAGASEPPRPPAPIKSAVPSPSADPDTTAGTVSWPVRTADNDHVPLDMVLAYASQPQRGERDAGPAIRPEPIAAAAPPKTATLRGDTVASLNPLAGIAPVAVAPVPNVTTVPKKNVVRSAAIDPVQRAEAIQRAKPIVAVANAGMRYDDPWLRAMILAPSLSSSMTSTLYGEPDLAELRALMNKPTSSIMMSFSEEPYPGIAANRFSGEAVVFLATTSFQRRTASLR